MSSAVQQWASTATAAGLRNLIDYAAPPLGRSANIRHERLPTDIPLANKVQDIIRYQITYVAPQWRLKKSQGEKGQKKSEGHCIHPFQCYHTLNVPQKMRKVQFSLFLMSWRARRCR